MKAPKGYKFSGISSGIKKKGLDLGLIFFEKPMLCVAAFTKNLLKSNSIIISQKHLKESSNKVRCIIVNSGCANTACGKNGLKDTEEICNQLAKKLKINSEEVLIASTGVIGEPLPKNKIIFNLSNLISGLSSDKNSIINFATAIMTTDTRYKVVYKEVKVKNKKKTLLCIAKGSGMIAPQLELYKPSATMLVFLLTDIAFSRSQMSQIMYKIIIPHFNSFSIDGDTSPNDTIFFVSNNCLGDKLNKKELNMIEEYIENICKEMILKLLFDGEGVTKVIKIVIKNCNVKEAKIISNTVANSLLVKTAFYGGDPNWGRILSACGRSGVNFRIDKVNIWIGRYQVVKNGNSNFISDEDVSKEMKKNYYEVIIDLGKNKNSDPFVFYTTDLSTKYVEINSMYKT
ncbi:MAG: bifunctional glutamate N-acetyltransferase/amino-acid acetyltransferase ArgJ [Elusimicrobiota bacterium]|nr:bifunctional glutamate N-acetyltransferase/amino-acid acetyltransferase ArgJ [Endomicrobiia bacterium]MDW8164900.1 bifunctional glutamate N-acetyltransferase/amino-acid acetyltransferase ArgJ [Elusimicrobiota bacterium]